MGDRKTGHWLRGLDDCGEMTGEPDRVQLISIMDHGADVLELILRTKRLGTIETLVSTQHSRVMVADSTAFDDMLSRIRQPKMGLQLARPTSGHTASRWRRQPRREAYTALIPRRKSEPARPQNGRRTVRKAVIQAREYRALAYRRQSLDWFRADNPVGRYARAPVAHSTAARSALTHARLTEYVDALAQRRGHTRWQSRTS